MVAEIGGQDKPGIGFALSIERLLLALESQEIQLPTDQGLDCFVVTLGEEAKTLALNWPRVAPGGSKGGAGSCWTGG